MSTKTKSSFRGNSKTPDTTSKPTTTLEDYLAEPKPTADILKEPTKKHPKINILEDLTDEEDVEIDIEVKKKILSIYEFTNLLLERAELPIKGTIKYICCSNPWKKKYDDNISYRVVPIYAIYEGSKKGKITYDKMNSLMSNRCVFTANTTQYRKLSENGIQNGFVIEVSLYELISKNGYKYYKYFFGDKLSDAIKATIKEFHDKNYEDLNTKFGTKTQAEAIEEDLNKYIDL
jgi:hypothetical protein